LAAPSISGTPATGETLQADAGVWGGTETEIGYQWERCNSAGGECTDVAGATEPSYTIPGGDTGKTLRVRVGVSNALGSLTAVSPASSAIEAAAATLANTLAPSISGTPRDGETLTADAGSWLGLSTIGYAYQWQRCDRYGNGCENISGATASTHALISGDVGHALRVHVIAEETGEMGGTVSETSPATAAIAGEGDPTIEEPPVVYGTGFVGYTLTASTGAWSGEAISYAYQWERCGEEGGSCSSISGATASSYTLTESDLAHTLRVLVTATDGTGNTIGISGPTATISPTGLVDVSAPSISGRHELGRALSTDPGIWTGAESIVFSYQWKRCNEHGESCSSISGATEPTYTPTGSDVGHTIEVVVTATGTSGSTNETSTPTPVIVSEPMAPENLAVPSIVGNPTTEDTLTAQPGMWLGSEPITYSYQWQKCNGAGEECANIEGATAETYTLPEGDIGSTLRVVVSAGNSEGSASATSSPTDVIGAPGVPASTEGPVIEGTAKVGERLFVDNGTWSGSLPLSYYYKWERCNPAGASCSAIEGATKPSYTVMSGDVGHSLRVRVTASNTLGSASALSPPAIVVAAGEANIETALKIAEETDPSVLAPSTTANLEEQAVKPALTDPGEELSSTATLNSSSVSKETPGEFAVETPDGEFSISPLATSPNATTMPTIVNGAAALFAETSYETDTIVRPSALGATDLLQLRSSAAPASFSWEVGIGPDQQLEELPDGSIAITEPEPGSALESSLPEELLEEPKTESGEPSGEGMSGSAAEEELESSVAEEGPVEKLADAPHITTSEITPKPGELHPQDTQTQYEYALGGLEYAKAHTSNKLLMVIRKPTVVDASGEEMPVTLSVAGNTFKMTISPTEKAVFPLTAALVIPGDTGGTPYVKVHYGLSDPKAEDFEKAEEEPGTTTTGFDKHLLGLPLHVKVARDVIHYNADAEERTKLLEWLKAVNNAGGKPSPTKAPLLEPYVTFEAPGDCKTNEKTCPAATNLNLKTYAKDIKEVITEVAARHKEEPYVVPAIRRWGAWNEPDYHNKEEYNPLYKHPEEAALFWKKARAILNQVGCDCTMVAGEFATNDGYVSEYKNTIRTNHKFWARKPGVWGLHDYEDLIHVTHTHPYFEDYAKAFVHSMDKGWGHPRIWLSEAGVELENNHEPTSLAKGSEPLKLQRLAAYDFLHLHKVSEQYIELIDYYGYKGPSAEQLRENKYYFDSALLPGQGVHETQEPREAYCVIALEEEGCPPKVITKAPVPGTTTSSASTPLLTVNPRGLPAHYFIEYGTTTGYGHTTSSTAVANSNGTQSETVSLSGLEPCTTYHYQAEAESSADEGKPVLGGDQTFTTECEFSGTITAEYTETPELIEEGGLVSFAIPLYPGTEKEVQESTFYDKGYHTNRILDTFSPRLPASRFSSFKATLLSGPGKILGYREFAKQWYILVGSEWEVLIPFPIPPTTWVLGIEGKYP
jgi:Ig domain of plant-specific actin-binding protein